MGDATIPDALKSVLDQQIPAIDKMKKGHYQKEEMKEGVRSAQAGITQLEAEATALNRALKPEEAYHQIQESVNNATVFTSLADLHLPEALVAEAQLQPTDNFVVVRLHDSETKFESHHGPGYTADGKRRMFQSLPVYPESLMVRRGSEYCVLSQMIDKDGVEWSASVPMPYLLNFLRAFSIIK
jgi:hypothetical protein